VQSFKKADFFLYLEILFLALINSLLSSKYYFSLLEPIAPVTDSWAQGSVPIIMERSSSAASSTGTSITSEANSEDSCIEEDRPGLVLFSVFE
jgi:hypothetical protein